MIYYILIIIIYKYLLGNIRLKYKDVRISSDQLDIVGVYNYYPFGQLIDNRTWEGSSARFGFQGQQRDDEIAGKGNSLATYFRLNSTQTGRWLSIDPKADKYPGASPYTLYGNSPIVMVDPRGDAPYAQKLDGTWNYVNTSLASQRKLAGLTAFASAHFFVGSIVGNYTGFKPIRAEYDNIVNFQVSTLSVGAEIIKKFKYISPALNNGLSKAGNIAGAAQTGLYFLLEDKQKWAIDEFIESELQDDMESANYEQVVNKYEHALRIVTLLVASSDILIELDKNDELKIVSISENAKKDLNIFRKDLSDGFDYKFTQPYFIREENARIEKNKTAEENTIIFNNVIQSGNQADINKFLEIFPEFKSDYEEIQKANKK